MYSYTIQDVSGICRVFLTNSIFILTETSSASDFFLDFYFKPYKSLQEERNEHLLYPLVYITELIGAWNEIIDWLRFHVVTSYSDQKALLLVYYLFF